MLVSPRLCSALFVGGSPLSFCKLRSTCCELHSRQELFNLFTVSFKLCSSFMVFSSSRNCLGSWIVSGGTVIWYGHSSSSSHCPAGFSLTWEQLEPHWHPVQKPRGATTRSLYLLPDGYQQRTAHVHQFHVLKYSDPNWERELKRTASKCNSFAINIRGERERARKCGWGSCVLHNCTVDINAGRIWWNRTTHPFS